MGAYLLAFVVSAAVSLPLVPWIRAAALRHGLVDPSGGRKAHTGDVPRLGGLGIFVGFAAGVAAACPLLRPTGHEAAAHIALGAAFIFALGIADDLLHRRGRHGLPALAKLIVQFGAAALVATTSRVRGIGIPHHEYIHFALWLQWAVTLVWIVGVSNAINLIDGMDGLAGGVSLIIAATMAVVASTRAHVAPFNTAGETVLALALMGGLIGFLRCNFPPATIFMGDGGALLLGFVLSSISVSGVMKSATIIGMGAPLVILALPMIDMTKVVLGRVMRGESPMSADRTHLHHRLQDAGWSVYSALLFVYGICGLCCSAALSMLRIHGGAAVLSLAVALLLVWVAAKRPRTGEFLDEAGEETLDPRFITGRIQGPR